MSNSKTSLTMPRRRFLRASAALAAAGPAAAAVRWTTPARAQTAPTIPSKTIRLAANPYGNHAWVVLAGQQGYLKDVGITAEPAQPKMVLEQQSVPQLENNEIDVSTMYIGTVTGAADKVPTIRTFFVHSYWAGNVILVSPSSGYKTVDEFIAEGKPWAEAAKLAMAQLKGQEIAVPPNPSTYPWMNLAYSFAGLKMEDSKVIAVEDPKAVQLAISDKIKAAAPGGAVQIYQLQFQANWKPLMSTLQMVKYVPGGPGSEINNVLNYDGLITTQHYIDENRDTVLRLSAALYRTLDYMFGPRQMEALAKYAPFINASAGSELDASAIKFIFEVLDPFFLWRDQPKLWTDPSYPLYFKNIYQYQLEEYQKSGAIAKQAYDLDAMFPAKQLWQEMKSQSEKAQQLMQKAQGATLADDRRKLLDEGKRHYDGHNYLDAGRFMEAALA
jgi:ABC-type nitrate/sulfonate/bicarbonate transport system substrate-binding protein